MKNEGVEIQAPNLAVKTYTEKVSSSLNSVPEDALSSLLEILEKIGTSSSKLMVAGNGGSASVSNHIACDLAKGTYVAGNFCLRTFSLAANQALCSAIANDFGYENVFSRQVEMFADPDDALMLVSSSGNSPNIVRAAEFAKSIGVKVIGMSGFNGGELANISDISLHINENNYGIVEDCHMMLIHIACQTINSKYDHGFGTF